MNETDTFLCCVQAPRDLLGVCWWKTWLRRQWSSGGVVAMTTTVPSANMSSWADRRCHRSGRRWGQVSKKQSNIYNCSFIGICYGHFLWTSTFPLCAPEPVNIEGNAESARVMGLMPWMDYEFQVIASNILGSGEPSMPSHTIRTQQAGEVPQVALKRLHTPLTLSLYLGST